MDNVYALIVEYHDSLNEVKTALTGKGFNVASKETVGAAGPMFKEVGYLYATR